MSEESAQLQAVLLESSRLLEHLLLVTQTEAPAQISLQLKSQPANASDASVGPICCYSAIDPAFSSSSQKLSLLLLAGIQQITVGAARLCTTRPRLKLP